MKSRQTHPSIRANKQTLLKQATAQTNFLYCNRDPLGETFVSKAVLIYSVNIPEKSFTNFPRLDFKVQSRDNFPQPQKTFNAIFTKIFSSKNIFKKKKPACICKIPWENLIKKV